MKDLLIYADIDGVLTPCQKLFHCRPNRSNAIDSRWYKTFSDRDSYVMRLMKDDLVFISNDQRNKHYTYYKGHKFCYVSHDKDKYYGLAADWQKRVENGEVEGDPFTPRYFYIGDAPFDWLCLINAIHGFVPRDCSPILQMKLTAYNGITRLPTSGGQGCLETMICEMWAKQEQYPDVAKLGVIKAIDEFIDGDI